MLLHFIKVKKINPAYVELENASLTHSNPVLLFYTPYQKTFRFSSVFRGYRKATPGCNGLKKLEETYIEEWLSYVHNLSVM